MKPALAYLRLALALRSWAPLLGLIVGLLALLGPWVREPEAVSQLLMPLVAVVVALLLGFTAAHEDRSSATHFFSRPLGAAQIACLRLCLDVVLASVAGALAGLPGSVARALEHGFTLQPTAGALALWAVLVLVLLVRVVGELVAAAAHDRSLSLVLDVVAVAAAAWMVATAYRISSIGAERLEAVCLIVVAATAAVALVVAAVWRFTGGRGDATRAHRAGAAAVLLVLAPGALAIDRWEHHIDGPVRAVDLDQVTWGISAGLDNLFFLWGHTSARFDLPVGALVDAGSNVRPPAVEWVLPSPTSRQIALAAHRRSDEGVGFSVLRRGSDGGVVVTPSPLVFEMHPRAASTLRAVVSDDGRLLARSHRGLLSLWELETGREIASTKMLTHNLPYDLYFDGEKATVAALEQNPDGTFELSVASLAPDRQTRQTVLALAPSRFPAMGTFGDRLLLRTDDELVVTTLAGEVLARRAVGPSRVRGFLARTADGTIVASSGGADEHFLELFDPHGEPLGVVPLPPAAFLCGSIGERSLLLRAGDGVSRLDLKTGALEPVAGAWRCASWRGLYGNAGEGIVLREEPTGAFAVWSTRQNRPVPVAELLGGGRG